MINVESKLLGNKKPKLYFKYKTNFSERDTEEYDNWISFYPKKTYFKFQIDSYGYFDPRPMLRSNITSVLVLSIFTISLLTLNITWLHLMLLPFMFFGWGDFYINLPFDTGKTDESESPSYGFYMYHIDPIPGKINFPTCFIWQWNNYKSWDMPWAHTWVRTSMLLKNLSWAHDTKENRKDFHEDKWENVQYVVNYDFTDKTDGQIIPTKVYVKEREWRQHWLKWTKIGAKIRKTIDVNFSKEVGSRKGSWKGGTLGCGYLMKKGETALECIKRMEKERVFK